MEGQVQVSGFKVARHYKAHGGYCVLPLINGFSMMLDPIRAITSCPVRAIKRGWSGGAMVLGKLPVPGRPTYLE